MLGEFSSTSQTHYLLGLDVIGQQQGVGWAFGPWPQRFRETLDSAMIDAIRPDAA